MTVLDQPAAPAEAPAENVLTASGLDRRDADTARVLKGVPGGDPAEVAYQSPAGHRHGDPRRGALRAAQPRHRPRMPVELQGGQVRVMQRRGQRAPRADVQDPRRRSPPGPVTVHPLKSFPLIKDLVTDVSRNYEVNREIPPFTAAPDDGTPWRIPQQDIDRLLRVPQVHRVLPLPGRLPHPSQSRLRGPLLRPAILRAGCVPGDASQGYARSARSARDQGGLGYCNITKCCTEVCPSTSTSPTTRSSRSRSGWPTCTGTRCALSGASSSVATGIDRRHRPERSPRGDGRGLRSVLLLFKDPGMGPVGHAQGAAQLDGGRRTDLRQPLPAGSRPRSRAFRRRGRG